MTSTIQTPAGRIGYTQYGSQGTPVVLVPGIGDLRSSYRALGPVLAAAGHRVYAVDLRGHGDSDAGFGSYTSEDIGDDVVALLDALDLRDAVLVGNSIGAAASAHASLGSDRIARLVLLSGFLDDPPGFAWMRVLLLLLFRWPWGVTLWGMYRKTLFATAPADLGANQDEVLANLREPGRLTAVRAMMGASKAGVAARLSQVRVPCLIAMGAADPDFTDPEAEARRQADLLGGRSTVVLIGGAGHYPQIEQPAETACTILAFLDEPSHDGA